MTGRSGGAVSISGELSFFENCIFSSNNASSGPAVFNIGTIRDAEPTDLEFASNSLVCDDGQFIDYNVSSLSDDEAADPDVVSKVTLDACSCP